MYIPKHFQITDTQEITRFIQDNSFAVLLTNVEGSLNATHLPLLYDAEQQTLTGHVAKQNPQASPPSAGDALVIFQGPHAYVSPNWYHSAGAPTWNYQAVHVSGSYQTFNDTMRLQQLVDQITEKYEASFAAPWQPNYPAAMLNAITGIEISITQIECKYKLSQNRKAVDQQSVIDNLNRLGETSTAKAMASFFQQKR